jgi:hypothetical protein
MECKPKLVSVKSQVKRVEFLVWNNISYLMRKYDHLNFRVRDLVRRPIWRKLYSEVVLRRTDEAVLE